MKHSQGTKPLGHYDNRLRSRFRKGWSEVNACLDRCHHLNNASSKTLRRAEKEIFDWRKRGLCVKLIKAWQHWSWRSGLFTDSMLMIRRSGDSISASFVKFGDTLCSGGKTVKA